MNEFLKDMFAGLVGFILVISGLLFFFFGYIGLSDGFEEVFPFFLIDSVMFFVSLIFFWKSQRVRAWFLTWLIPWG